MLIGLVLNALAFYVTAYLVPGVQISGWGTLLVVSVVWGILSILVKPILLILTLPINIMTLGLFTLVINGLLLLITSSLVPGFVVSGLWTAIVAAIVLSLVNMVLSQVQ